MVQLPLFQALSSVCTPKPHASGWELICIHQGQVTEMVSWCLGYCSKSYVSFQPSTKRSRISTVFQRPGSGAWFWVWRQTLSFQQPVCFTMHEFPSWTICTHGSSFQTGRGAQPTVWSLMTANAHWAPLCVGCHGTHTQRSVVPSSKGSPCSIKQAGQTCRDLGSHGGGPWWLGCREPASHG